MKSTPEKGLAPVLVLSAVALRLWKHAAIDTMLVMKFENSVEQGFVYLLIAS